MSTVKIKASFLNAMAKKAHGKVSSLLSQVQIKDMLAPGVQSVGSEGNRLFNIIRATEEILKHPVEIDQNVDVSLEDWLVVTNWANREPPKSDTATKK